MRRLVLSFCLCFPLLLNGCSLVADFPAERRDASDEPAVDAGKIDASVDAAQRDSGQSDTGAGSSCNLDTHAGCEEDELCCKSSDGSDPACIEVSSGACASCSGACTSERAPYCSSRENGCECVEGSGESCPQGQSCALADGVARCVECSVDTDCKDPALPVCVENRCRQCDRGEDLEDSADDRGCALATPICNAENRCEACTGAPADNCPEGQQCTPASGCFGCSGSAEVTKNGCSPTTPICKPVTTEEGMNMQCVGCTSNLDCMPLLYCDQRSGTCNNVCDPDGGIDNDGCEGEQPICKATAAGGFACRPCAPSDCGEGTFCAMGNHPKRGSCVGCRLDGDCPGAAPICDTTSFTCRARVAADCPNGQQLLNGACVECVTNAHCPAGEFCAGNVCGQCATSANCPMDKPVCDTTTMPWSCGCATDAQCTTATLPFCDVQQRRCEGCTSTAQCRMKFPNTNCDTNTGACVGCVDSSDCPDATPICSTARTCVACDTLASAADAQCAMRMPGSVCATAGPQRGKCTLCDPADNGGCPGSGVCNADGTACAACDPATEMGCSPPLGQCFVRPGATAPTCNACEPNVTNAGCPAGQTCTLVLTSYTCVPPVVVVPDAGAGAPQPEAGI